MGLNAPAQSDAAQNAKPAPAAQPQAAQTSAPANPPHEEKVYDVVRFGNSPAMLVRILDTPEKNEGFQQNVNIMRQHTGIILNAKNRYEAMKDGEEKTELAKKIKQMEDEYKTNEGIMQKAYAFASDRQYRLVFIKTTLCVPLTNDELSTLRMKDGEEIDPLKVSEKNGKKYYCMREISGIKENEELQRFLAFSINRKADMEKLRETLGKTTDPQEQLSVTEKISQAEKAVKQNDEELKTRYNLKGKQSYLVQIDLSKLYLMLTQEEVLKIQAQRQQQAANAPAK